MNTNHHAQAPLHIAVSAAEQQDLIRASLDMGKEICLQDRQVVQLLHAAYRNNPLTKLTLVLANAIPTDVAVEQWVLERDPMAGWYVRGAAAVSPEPRTRQALGDDLLKERFMSALDAQADFTCELADAYLLSKALVARRDGSELPFASARLSNTEVHTVVFQDNARQFYRITADYHGQLARLTYGIPTDSPVFETPEYLKFEAEDKVQNRLSNEDPAAESIVDLKETYEELKHLHRWATDKTIHPNHALILSHATSEQVIENLTRLRGQTGVRNHALLSNNNRQLLAVRESISIQPADMEVARTFLYFTIGEVTHPSGRTVYVWKNIPTEFKQPLLDLYLASQHA